MPTSDQLCASAGWCYDHLVQPAPKLRSHMPFSVQAYIDDHLLTATFETAKQAFAEAIDWKIAKQLNDIMINDGANSFTIAEFASRMAQGHVAETVEARSQK